MKEAASLVVARERSYETADSSKRRQLETRFHCTTTHDRSS